MTDAQDIALEGKVPADDPRLAAPAVLLGGSDTLTRIGEATILGSGLAVTTAELANMARVNRERAGSSYVLALTSKYGDYRLPATILAIDGKLGFGMISFSGTPPGRDLGRLRAAAIVPPPLSPCEYMVFDGGQKVFLQLRGRAVGAASPLDFKLEPPANAPTPEIAAPVFHEGRIVGIVAPSGKGWANSSSLIDVITLAAMERSTVTTVVQGFLRQAEAQPSSSPRAARKASVSPTQTAEDGPPNAVVSSVSDPAQAVVRAEWFGRLSPSSRSALERANGLRTAMGLKEVHMEQLFVGLFEKWDGPTRRVLARAKIDQPKLLEIIHEARDQKIPSSYTTAQLSALPPLSGHVSLGLIAAVRRADERGSKFIRSRHLLYGALSVDECGMIRALQERGVKKEDIDQVVAADEGAEREISAAPVAKPEAVRIFVSHSNLDEKLFLSLETYLSVLERDGLISLWYDRKVSAGDKWDERLEEYLRSAQIILLLVSPNYLASDFCYLETTRAMERQAAGGVTVIPVILEPVDWKRAPFATLQALPKDAAPITTWKKPEEALLNVVAGVRRVAEDIQARTPAPPPTEAPASVVTPPTVPGYSDVLALSASPTPKVDSDLWCDEDRLGYEAYARTIASLITHKDTVPPLTIGIKAPWGAGKTSLMKGVQHLLDGYAELSEEGRTGILQEWQPPQTTLRELLDQLKASAKPNKLGVKESKKGKAYGLPPRMTIWFNAWKYQTSEQIWAGMAHCIISQVTARMGVKERELFWLRLHGRRINVDEVRKKIYGIVLRKLVPMALFVVVACVIAFWIAALLPLIPWWWRYVLRGVPVIWGAYRLRQEWASKLGEKAAETMRELVREPNYEGKMGYLHLVESDMREVLQLATEGSVTKEKPNGDPLVVFVDDLDRCAPNKVAEVVEAINLFLCGDYPNCIFVLAMEPGMVAAALEVANQDVIEKAVEMGVTDPSAPVGWRFMEKIVQLPIMIPPPTALGKKSYVESLTGFDAWGPGAAKVTTGVVANAPTAAPGPLDEKEVVRYMEELKATSLSEVEEKSQKVLSNLNVAPVEQRRAAAEASKRMYAQTFSERDPAIVEFVRDVAELVDGNPRQIKRYVNVFRFYSTLRHSLRVDGTVPVEDLPSDKMLAKFLALSIQWPHAMDCLRAKNCACADGRVISRLEFLEMESAKITGTGGDAVWRKIVGKEGMGLGPWAEAPGFRAFLGRGESLGKSGGHGLW